VARESREPAPDEREEHLVDDLDQGLLVGGAEATEDLVSEQVDRKGGDS